MAGCLQLVRETGMTVVKNVDRPRWSDRSVTDHQRWQWKQASNDDRLTSVHRSVMVRFVLEFYEIWW